MALEIIPGRYFVGFFYLGFPGASHMVGKIGPFGKGGNLQALVWKDGEEPPGEGPHDWKMRYRFRYYRDKRIHDHGDVMKWFEVTMPNMTEAEVTEKAEQFITISGAIINTKPHVWLIQGNCERFTERVKEDPPYWMHVKPILDDPVLAKELDPLTKMNRKMPKILEGPMHNLFPQ